jgi:hypothetical protein
MIVVLGAAHAATLSGNRHMATELEGQLAELKQGDHICLIYENTAEQLAVAVPFFKDGLSR